MCDVKVCARLKIIIVKFIFAYYKFHFDFVCMRYFEIVKLQTNQLYAPIKIQIILKIERKFQFLCI